MNIQKLDNGRYRVRQYENGKRYSVSFDHKPTTKEILTALAEKMGKEPHNPEIKGRIEEYALKLISKKRDEGKSSTTIRGYVSIMQNTPDWFSCLYLGAINDVQCQTLIDEYAGNHSAKSTRNLWSFYQSVIKEYRPEYNPHVELPAKEKNTRYEPSTKDIQRILEAAEGSRYEIPFKLAVLGLRRGEICALSLNDLNEDNVLTINKDMVLDETNKYYIKESPKTNASNRRILIPASIADKIRAQGFVFEGNPHTINEALHTYQDRLKIPRFRLHDCRHFACAFLHQQGFTDSQILEFCGFEENSEVMKKVYRYNLDPEKAQANIAVKFENLM